MELFPAMRELRASYKEDRDIGIRVAVAQRWRHTGCLTVGVGNTTATRQRGETQVWRDAFWGTWCSTIYPVQPLVPSTVVQVFSYPGLVA